MVSIIIVHYHVNKEIIECIKSIIASKPKTPYEIIVVDNDEKPVIYKELKNIFPKVKYIKNTENIGFGAGNNRGAKIAKGEFLFFLNPDTKIYKNTLDNLINFLSKHKEAEIVSPLLHDQQGNVYQQGSLELTPSRAIFCLSFINKLFPNNPISKMYWLNNWNKKTIREVDVAPGTAFIIRKDIFKKMKGFDENFFLYFEEFDLCRRLKKLGGKIFIIPSAKVEHTWGSSTKQRKDIESIFRKSRFYYFSKHFGILQALTIEAILRVNKYTLLLGASILLGLFIRIFRIDQTMPFIGDQGWFYLSARDMLLTGKIPLVGIPSSHPWLHQGALWTYILGLGFLALGFNPFTGVYISIFLDLLAIFAIYKIGTLMFSQKVGIIATILYTFSPLVIFHAIMPYHTSPIPLFTLFYLLSLLQWMKGNSKYFPIIILSLAILYNLEIATFLLTIIFISFLTFGLLKRKKWTITIFNKKNILYTLTAFFIPMLPMLIYDINHGFPQTLRFIAWMGYKILVFFGYPPLHPEISSPNFNNLIFFIVDFFKTLIYLPSIPIALTIIILSMFLFYKRLFNQLLTKKYNIEVTILGTTFAISIVGIIVTKTTSGAYLPILFPTTILIIAFFLDRLLLMKSKFRMLILLLITVISFTNAYSILTYKNIKGFSDRLTIAKTIISESRGRGYNLIGKGEGSQFVSFTMNYEYLTWWLGNGPSKEKEKLLFIITEDDKGIKLTKKENNLYYD